MILLSMGAFLLALSLGISAPAHTVSPDTVCYLKAVAASLWVSWRCRQGAPETLLDTPMSSIAQASLHQG